MKEQEKAVDEIGEIQTVETESGDSRRDFMTKLAAAAGAVVVASMLPGSEAGAAEMGGPNTRLASGATAGQPLNKIGNASISNIRRNNGLTMQLTNKEVVQSIARESLGLNVPGAEAMELSLTWK